MNPPLVRSAGALVAAPEPVAGEVGAQILRRGGNAADAAIAVAFALAVTLPEAGNLGGGGFWMWRGRRGDRAALDYRETAPARAAAGMYLDPRGKVRDDDRGPLTGYRAVGVPGTVAGMDEALRRFGSGRLAWADLVDPARALAEDGIVVTQRLARSIGAEAHRLRRFPSSAAVFLPGGAPPEPGTRLRQPDLAATLARLRDRGPAEMAVGETARRIADAMARHGGLIDARDLAGYRARHRRPLEGVYRRHRVVAMPPPSSGGIALLTILRQLEGFPLGRYAPEDPARLHLLAEAMRRAFADRAAYLGDTDFVRVPVAALLDPERAAAWRRSIRPDRATPSLALRPGAALAPESLETTHFTVVDGDGAVVSNTYTLNGAYGAAVVADGTGILLNNEMDDFAALPGTANQFGLVQSARNAIAPGKRPLSSMSPTIVERPDGRLMMAVGSPGGPTIINTVLQILLHAIDHGRDIAAAIGAPRIHHQWLPDQLVVERDLADAVPDLRRRGHTVVTRPLGDAHGILVDESGARTGASDPRGGGRTVAA